MPRDLARAADGLATRCEPRWADLAERAARVAARHRARRFHVAVVGEFKRGKSTLVNALVGAAVMPTGVLPTTSVATEVVHGSRSATVIDLDGASQPIAVEELAEFVTEQRNPHNRRGIAKVQVALPLPLLASGMVLIDTPGTGSTFEHNTTAAWDAQRDADAAIVVVAADNPLSAAERTMLASFADRPTKPLIVLTKADRLSVEELTQVRRFVIDACGVPDVRLWAVNGKAAASGAGDALEFDEFRAAFARFVNEDLAAARDATTATQIEHIATEALTRIAFEKRASSLHADDLATRTDALAAAIDREQSGFEAERLLLTARCQAIGERLAAELAQFARDEPSRHRDAIIAFARAAPLGGLDDRIRDAVAAEVRAGFDPMLERQRHQIDAAWHDAADRFRHITQSRVDAVRSAAGALFEVQLEAVHVPNLADETDRFSYLFLAPAVMPLPFEHAARRLLPASMQRQRVTERALRYLNDEFDKHAGRVRYALTEQLAETRRHFESAMTTELEHVSAALLDALQRARQANTASQDELRQRLNALDALRDELCGTIKSLDTKNAQSRP